MQKLLQEAFWKSDQFLRVLFNEVHDLILVHGYTEQNTPGPFLDVNDFTCQRLGFTREELMQRTVVDLLPETETSDVKNTSQALQDKKYLVFEKTFKAKSGELVALDVNAHRITVNGKPYTISICRDITERKKREVEREKLVADLTDALSDVKRLGGLLPICSCCKKIRDDKGYWHQLEEFLKDHSEAQFSHGFCLECAKKMYPNLKLNGVQ